MFVFRKVHQSIVQTRRCTHRCRNRGKRRRNLLRLLECLLLTSMRMCMHPLHADLFDKTCKNNFGKNLTSSSSNSLWRSSLLLSTSWSMPTRSSTICRPHFRVALEKAREGSGRVIVSKLEMRRAGPFMNTISTQLPDSWKHKLVHLLKPRPGKSAPRPGKSAPGPGKSAPQKKHFHMKMPLLYHSVFSYESAT